MPTFERDRSLYERMQDYRGVQKTRISEAIRLGVHPLDVQKSVGEYIDPHFDYYHDVMTRRMYSETPGISLDNTTVDDRRIAALHALSTYASRFAYNAEIISIPSPAIISAEVQMDLPAVGN